MTQVVVPLSGPTATVIAQAEVAKRAGADVVELRLDRCPAPQEVLSALERLPLPALVTIRHASEGGGWSGSPADRAALYAAADGRAAMIDVELQHFADLRWRPARSRLVLSSHDFSGPGGDLPATIAAMRAAGADIPKVAITARDAADLALVRHLYSGASAPLVAIAMGEHGLPSRLLAQAWGAAFTFARLDDDEGSAPGQPTVGELLGRYRLRSQRATTAVYGVIGSPVAHSLSPHIHNAAFAHEGRDAVYVPFRVEDPLAFWQACGAWIAGLSITIPHKHDLISMMSGVEEPVTRIGAMNTIYRSDDGPIGANTDAVAIQYCLEQELGSLAGRRVLILGAGGVAKAIAHAVQERGAQVMITNRSRDRAEVLAAEVGGTAIDDRIAAGTPYDVLINGTSVGMGKPDESPWPATAHRPGTLVFDTVYTPLETRFLKDAQRAGAATICGLQMFIAQAAAQYDRWFGRAAPVELMQRVALERLGG